MIIGSCNYCNELFNTSYTIGAVEKITCTACKKHFFLFHSSIDPVSYCAEDVEVNEETKTLKLKLPQSR